MAYRPAVALIDKLLPSEYKTRKRWRSRYVNYPKISYRNIQDMDPDTIWRCDYCHKYLTSGDSIMWECRKIPAMQCSHPASAPPPRVPVVPEAIAYLWIARCVKCCNNKLFE